VTIEDKLRAIQRWCFEFAYSQGSHGRWRGRIIYTNKYAMRPNFTINCVNYDDMVKDAYKMVHEYVWGFVQQVELECALIQKKKYWSGT